jgi:hypothetical protein
MDDAGSSSEHWLLKAAEARKKAEHMRTSYARTFILEEAVNYERLALEAKVRSRQQEKPTKSPH